MCPPTAYAIVSIVATVASGVASYVSQKNAAEQSENIANVEAKNAQAAAASDYQQQQLQQEQINAAAAQDQTERIRQSLKERAALRVASAEAGLQVGREELSSYQSASRDIAVMEANRKAGVNQTQAQKEATHATAQGRINSAMSRVQAAPNPYMAGLQIATSAAASGMSGYAAGKSLE